MAILELLAPRRALRMSKGRRWWINLAIVVADTVLVRFVFPVTAVQAAIFATENGWGLFNLYEVPYVFAVIACVVILDGVIYLQHVMFHAVPMLWKFHMVHHADIDLDVTSGLRFHPVEIIASMGLKIAVIAALGPPALAVVIFEVLLNGTAMFNHSNVRLPLAFDRVLRLIVVTPDMHRVHHSIDPEESNSNFGFNLPWWDRAFGTYKPQPDAGHETMDIGLKAHRDPEKLGLARILAMPFNTDTGEYTINKRKYDK